MAKQNNKPIIDDLISSLVQVLKVKKNLILQGAPGTGKTYIAKKLAASMIGKDFEESSQFKIVQFHPSYTYEDFVRGIIVTTDNDGNLTYVPTNKILADFAKEANDNYVDSHKESLAVNKLNWVRERWSKYKTYLSQEMQGNKDVKIGDYILTGVNPSNVVIGTYNLSDKLIVEAYIAREIDQDKTYTPPYFSKATWTTVSVFSSYLQEHKQTYQAPNGVLKDKIELKNFILIIDEINRANLPMVLGELIYALEYRGRKVETLYNVEGDNNIILPPNLYIIGTMNTADRSVGHIDYAIRRRFAFEYIEPRNIKGEELQDGATFDEKLFNSVQKIFDNHTWLSEEFDKRDVAIGHSYFITYDDPTKGMSRDMRIKYEVRPLLEEYIKDGILKKEYGGKQIQEELNSILK